MRDAKIEITSTRTKNPELWWLFVLKRMGAP